MDEQNLPVLIIGDMNGRGAERQVTTLEGEEWAAIHGCLFKETSAKTGINVDETLIDVVRKVRRRV